MARGYATMKVKDLIEQLSDLDPELMVVVSGYEGGVEEVGTVAVETIILNAHKEWYYGSHEVQGSWRAEEYPDHPRAQAVGIYGGESR